jgi:nucleotide-binding universal stress UspA family protein
MENGVMVRILVPTDLTSIAELGLQLAVEIAKKTNATICLVNFTRHPFSKSFTTMGDMNLKIDTEEDLYTIQLLHANKRELDRLTRKYNKDAVIESSIVDDDLQEGVDNYLTNERIDLIVMGTSGEENAEEIFKGNHTEQVIRISKCPVLSVRDGFNIMDFTNIVLAVGAVEEDLIMQGMHSLKIIADCFESLIHLVHIVKKADESTNEQIRLFNRLAQAAQLTNYRVDVLEAKDEAEGVILFAREVRAGLVAVIKTSPDRFFHIFSPLFSNRIVKELGRPVLTVNAHAE